MSYVTNTLLSGLMFPEGPRWHENRLWFTDQHAQNISAVNQEGAVELIAEIDDLPGGLGWLPDGALLVVSMKRRQILRLQNGVVDVYADLSNLAPFHCNDMLVDKSGRAYIGNFGYDLHRQESVKSTNLIMVDSNRNAHVVAEQLIFPNGMVFRDEGKMLVVAETFANRLTAFDIDEDGLPYNRRCYAQLGNKYPDGICVNQQGLIWVACPNVGCVVLVDEGGNIVQDVQTIGAPYACMLGGAENNWLFICTSETDDPALARKTRSGRIEVANLAK